MTLAAVEFKDVPAALVAKVKPLLAARYSGRGAVVVSKVEPTTRPARLVTFRRDGGPRRDVASETPRIGVNVWGANDDDADRLVSFLRAVLPLTADGDPICKVTEIGGPIDVTPASGQARRYFSLEVVARGQQL